MQVSKVTIKADPGGKGGAETQLAEVKRMNEEYLCRFCTVEHAHFLQIHKTDDF